MAERQPGRAVFYTRDSGGEHENTPGEYVRWASRAAETHKVRFAGTPGQIERMIRDGVAVDGDVFQDYGVKGNRLCRPGLDAMVRAVKADPGVSHVLIPRRDRLARPDDPLDGVGIENALRRLGVTVVFMDKVLGPLGRGRQDIGDAICGLVDYDKAGRERRDLAQKMLFAQLKLARLGFSTGGRPPYGFRRWLVSEAGVKVRLLADGEVVRMAGHHVVWLPSDDEHEWAVITRILELLPSTPASRIAATLTAEGVPSPDHGRVRTDNGVTHPTSGVWHQVTVVGVGRNPLLRAVVEYGRRSMGDQLRFDPTHPRELTAADLRADDQPKVVTNPPAVRVAAPARFDPPAPPELVDAAVAALDRRAGTQRGKPRSADPAGNPLGCRAFDSACGWPLYRQPYNGSYRYCCGLYQQSHGSACGHHHVDGPTAVRVVLACLRQRALSPAMRDKVRAKLEGMARREAASGPSDRAAGLRRELEDVRRRGERAGENLAMADGADQRRAIARVFDKLKEQERDLERQLATATPAATFDPAAEVAAAMAALDDIETAADRSADPAAVKGLFDRVNARLFLRFAPTAWGKRTVNKVSGGVVTFGSAPPPVALYEGPTGRRAVKSRPKEQGSGVGQSGSAEPDSESPSREDSLGNVSRADRIRTCDLLVPNQALYSTLKGVD